MVNTMESTVWWTDEKEENLVILWSEKPCLFDIQSKEYSDRGTKEKACEDIANKINMPAEQVKKRIKSLRTQYGKLRKPPASGTAAKTLSKKNSWILEHLQFLAPHMGIRPTTSNLEITQDQESYDEENGQINNPELVDENEVNETATATPQKISRPPSRMSDNDEIELNKATSKSTKRPTSQKISSKVAKKKREDRELEILEGLTQSLNEQSSAENSNISEIDCFCQYIAKSLKKFDQRTQNVVKNGIQNLIFQSEMENAGSVVPVAPEVYYHPAQPPHVPNTSGDHNTARGTLYEVMHDTVNMSW